MSNVFLKGTRRHGNDSNPRAAYKSLAWVAAVEAAGLKLRFDNEAQPRQKTYMRLASYSSPQVGDRVFMLPIGPADANGQPSGTYLVIGKVI